MSDNILCKDILYNMENFLKLKENKNQFRKDFIINLTESYISCEDTFMDSYLDFKKFVKDYKEEKGDNYRPL